MAAQQTFTSEAVIRLRDKLSGPLRGLGNEIDTQNKRFATFTKNAHNAGRAMTLGITGTATFGAIAAFRELFEYEREFNQANAARVNLTQEQLEAMRQKTLNLSKATQFTATETVGAMKQLLRAGNEFGSAMKLLPQTLDLAAAGSINVELAADLATNIISGMKLTGGDEERVLRKVNDILAFAAQKAPHTVEDIAQSFKYAAPIAAGLGVEIEDLGAAFTTMAKAGIRNSQAGVALRSMLVRMVRPTKHMRAEMARLGIELDDFVKGKEDIQGADVVKSIKTRFGLDLSGSIGEIDKVLAEGGSVSDLTAKLTDTIATQMGDTSAEGREKVSEAISQFLMGSVRKINLVDFVRALQEKGADAGSIAKLFDARQGARIQTLLDPEFLKLVNQFGGIPEGLARQMRDINMKGIVGDLLRLQSAFSAFIITAANKSGIVKDLSTIFIKLTDNINKLSETNPELMRMAAGLAVFSVAIGPVLWMVGNLARTLAVLKGSMIFFTGPLFKGVGASFALLAKFVRPAASGMAMMAGVNLGAMGANLAAGGMGARALAAGLRLVSAAFVATGVGAILIALAAAGTWIYNNWEGLGNLFQGFAEGIRRDFPAIGESMDWLSEKFTSLTNFFTDATGKVNVSQKTWYNWGLEAGKSVAGFADEVISMAGVVQDYFVNQIPGYMGQLSTKAGEAWDGLVFKLENKLGLLKGKFLAWIQELKDSFVGFFDGLEPPEWLKWVMDKMGSLSAFGDDKSPVPNPPMGPPQPPTTFEDPYERIELDLKPAVEEMKSDVGSIFDNWFGKPVSAEVTGPVEAELKGKADVNLRIKVDGPGRVAGMSQGGNSAPLNLNLGTTTTDGS